MSATPQFLILAVLLEKHNCRDLTENDTGLTQKKPKIPGQYNLEEGKGNQQRANNEDSNRPNRPSEQSFLKLFNTFQRDFHFSMPYGRAASPAVNQHNSGGT